MRVDPNATFFICPSCGSDSLVANMSAEGELIYMQGYNLEDASICIYSCDECGEEFDPRNFALDAF